MEETQYNRRLDSCGRLVIPSKLRDELHFEIGDIYNFVILEQNGKKYLAVECPEEKITQADVERAKMIMEKVRTGDIQIRE